MPGRANGKEKHWQNKLEEKNGGGEIALEQGMRVEPDRLRGGEYATSPPRGTHRKQLCL
ncbi:MAG: hypothetical protein Q7J84_03305 [Sulfuricaulis sp.]|nr:hypothetical protein [Sulfuricaulis sp.]